MKKIWNHTHPETKLILLACALLLIGLSCWLLGGPFKDFGLNFFTEMLGVIITVFVIDRLLQKREELKSIPLKLAAYEDVRMFITRYALFWQDLYRSSVPEDDPDTVEKFFSPVGMGKIWEYLCIEAEIGNLNRKKMWKHLSDAALGFKRKSDQILERHVSTLDPRAYKLLHQLSESWCIRGLIELPESFQGNIKRPVISILASYCMMPTLSDDYEPAIGLIQWCEKTGQELKKYDPEVRNVFIYASFEKYSEHPLYMIAPGIVEKEKQEMNKFQ